MFCIGEHSELGDNSLSTSTATSSMGLLNTNCDAMSRIQETREVNFLQETSVFGSFDPDDPDFSSQYSSNNLCVNSLGNFMNWSTNRLLNQASTLPSRPSSRQLLGRNNSSNSLKRTKSANSMGGSRFYIGKDHKQIPWT